MRNLAIALMVLCAWPAASQEVRLGPEIHGLGSKSCIDLRSEYSAARSSDDNLLMQTIYDLQIASWVGGFLTGLNGAMIAYGLPTRDLMMSGEDLVDFVLGHCVGHPDCPSSNNLRPLIVFSNGVSGSFSVSV